MPNPNVTSPVFLRHPVVWFASLTIHQLTGTCKGNLWLYCTINVAYCPPYLTRQISPTTISLTAIWMTSPLRSVENLCSCSILFCSPRNCFSFCQSLKAVTRTTTRTAPRIATPSIHPWAVSSAEKSFHTGIHNIYEIEFILLFQRKLHAVSSMGVCRKCFTGGKILMVDMGDYRGCRKQNKTAKSLNVPRLIHSPAPLPFVPGHSLGLPFSLLRPAFHPIPPIPLRLPPISPSSTLPPLPPPPSPPSLLLIPGESHILRQN